MYQVTTLSREGLTISQLEAIRLEAQEFKPPPPPPASSPSQKKSLFQLQEKEPDRPSELQQSIVHTIPNVAGYEWSTDGTKLLTWPNIAAQSNELSVWTADQWAEGPRLITAAGSIRNVFWSDHGKFILVYSTYQSPDRKNLEIFHCNTGQLILHATAKALREGACPFQFGANDAFVCRVVQDGLTVFDLRNLELPTHSSHVTQTPLISSAPIKFEQASIESFKVAPERKDGQLLVAFFAKGTKGMPSTIKVVSVFLPAREIRLINQKSLFQAQEALLEWNKNATFLLTRSHVDVDEKGTNYYGKSQLFLLEAAANSSVATVISTDQGPVHAFCWSKSNPDQFVAAYGPMPANLRVFSAKSASPVLSFTSGRRNTLIYSSDGRLLCVAGFGNLPGEMDIWDMTKGKVVGLTTQAWVVDCQFSPDGYWLLCSTTTPRLRVDNGIRVLRANGDLVFRDTVNELFRASWRPVKGVKPRALSPTRKFDVPVSKFYRAPGGNPVGSVPNVPSRLLTAVKVGAQSQVNTVPGLQLKEPKKGRGKKKEQQQTTSESGANKAVDENARRPKPLFDIEEVVEADIDPSKDLSVAVTGSNALSTGQGPEESKENSLLTEMSALSPSELVRRRNKISKMERDVKLLLDKKKLDPNQKRKLDRLPELTLELSIIDRVAKDKNIDLESIATT